MLCAILRAKLNKIFFVFFKKIQLKNHNYQKKLKICKKRAIFE